MAAGHALVMWVGEGVVAVVVRLRCNKSAGGPQTCCIDSVAGIKSMLQQPNTKSETDFFDVRAIFAAVPKTGTVPQREARRLHTPACARPLR